MIGLIISLILLPFKLAKWAIGLLLLPVKIAKFLTFVMGCLVPLVVALVIVVILVLLLAAR